MCAYLCGQCVTCASRSHRGRGRPPWWRCTGGGPLGLPTVCIQALPRGDEDDTVRDVNNKFLINFLIHLSLRRGKRARLLRTKTSFSFAPKEEGPPARRRLRAGFDPTASPVVGTSLIPNAGLGLFAAQRIPQGKLVVQMAPTNVVQYKCSSSDKKVTKPCGLRICSQLIYTGDKKD